MPLTGALLSDRDLGWCVGGSRDAGAGRDRRGSRVRAGGRLPARLELRAARAGRLRVPLVAAGVGRLAGAPRLRHPGRGARPATHAERRPLEFAWTDGTWNYLVSYTPTRGQPDDVTKEEWDLGLSVLDMSGAVTASSPRVTTHTIYDDASPAIGTPQDFDPLATIVSLALAQLPRMSAWVARLSAPPLWQQAQQAQDDAGSTPETPAKPA